MVPERDGPVPLDHHVGGPAHRAQPVPELGGVVDRRRQAHKGELGWREHEYLLPHASPVGVLEVVHLVQDDRGEAAQEVRAGEQHVAQHFGGHDHHWGVGPLGGVPGEQSDHGLAVGGDELGVLLVGERLERGGVEGLGPGSERGLDRVGGDEGLARPGRCRHEHGAPGVECVEGADLEVVEREGHGVDEALPDVGAPLPRDAAPPLGDRVGAQRPRIFPMAMETK